MKISSAFFIGKPGKGLPHTKNLYRPILTRGFSTNAMYLNRYTLCEV